MKKLKAFSNGFLKVFKNDPETAGENLAVLLLVTLAFAIGTKLGSLPW